MPRLADRRVKIDLLRAAEATFAEHGLSASKVEQITARAGVSKGAFYLHFESKEDCFRQIVEAFISRLAACLESPPAPLGDGGAGPAITLKDMREKWVAHNCDVLEFCWQNRALLRMIQAGGGAAPFTYLIDEFAERAAKQIENWTAYAKNLGIYRADVDVSIVATLIGGAHDRLVRELIKQPKRPNIEAWAQQAIDVFLLGLGNNQDPSAGRRKTSPEKPPGFSDPLVSESPLAVESKQQRNN